MFALVLATLVVASVGAVVTARIIYRRIETWADAMILSFGLGKVREEEDTLVDDLPSPGIASTSWGSCSVEPPRQVSSDESERRDPVGLGCF